MSARFCDFCSCDDCKRGQDYLSHAETVDGRFICDVCYLYDLCTRTESMPCESDLCAHRPALKTGEWTKMALQ